MSDSSASQRDPLAILTRAWQGNRLGHALLLHGPSLDNLQRTAEQLAGALLQLEEGRDPSQHPDCLVVRPVNRMRQIGVDAMRNLVRTVSHSANQAGHKVILIVEADRMNQEAANAFLKTLEEPPPQTTLFLLTSRPNDLLDTLRSRCQSFQIPGEIEEYTLPEWISWKSDFKQWLGRIESPPANPEEVAGTLLRLYGMVQRFQEVLDVSINTIKGEIKETLPPDTTEEEESAILAGKERGQRRRMLSEMQVCLRDHALSEKAENSDLTRIRAGKLVLSIKEVEATDGLLRVNFNAIAAIEQLFLRLLRIWSRQEG